MCEGSLNKYRKFRLCVFDLYYTTILEVGPFNLPYVYGTEVNYAFLYKKTKVCVLIYFEYSA